MLFTITLDAKNTIEINETELTVKYTVNSRVKKHIRFKTIAAAEKYAQGIAQEFFSKQREAVQKKQQMLAAAAEIKEGDIFVSSGGYEQTNVCFYQVVEKVGKQTLKVRKISAEKQYTESMSGKCTPNKDEFTGEIETKRLSRFADFNGHWGNARKWNGKPQFFSCYY